MHDSAVIYYNSMRRYLLHTVSYCNRVAYTVFIIRKCANRTDDTHTCTRIHMRAIVLTHLHSEWSWLYWKILFINPHWSVYFLVRQNNQTKLAYIYLHWGFTEVKCPFLLCSQSRKNRTKIKNMDFPDY